MKERMTSAIFRRSGPPQYPKAPALGPLQALLRDLAKLAPAPVFPLHAFNLAGHLFVTVPGEPTVMMAHRLERALVARTGLAGVTVLGYAGDSSGYYTTEEEYHAQHYEGAHTLYGRNTARHLEARLERLVVDAPPSPLLTSSVTFRSRPRAEPAPLAAEIIFAEGPFVRLEEHGPHGWRPVQSHGQVFDDVQEESEIIQHEDPFNWLGGQVAWSLTLWLPEEPTADQRLRVVALALP